jgi:hypothetical protein
MIPTEGVTSETRGPFLLEQSNVTHLTAVRDS